MAYTFKELKHKTVAELREIAAGIEHEAVQGHTQMNKDHLLDAICKALNIDKFEHHVATVSDKSKLKEKIRTLKAKRDKVIKEHNHAELKKIRIQIKNLKKRLRRAAV